jgi:hypothetical protein
MPYGDETTAARLDRHRDLAGAVAAGEREAGKGCPPAKPNKAPVVTTKAQLANDSAVMWGSDYSWRRYATQIVDDGGGGGYGTPHLTSDTMAGDVNP